MALAARLLRHLRRRHPPPLSALPRLAIADQCPRPSPPPLPLPLPLASRTPAFLVPSRSFSWHSHPSSGGEDASAGGRVRSDVVLTADGGDGEAAAGAPDAAGGAGGDGGGLSDFAVGSNGGDTSIGGRIDSGVVLSADGGEAAAGAPGAAGGALGDGGGMADSAMGAVVDLLHGFHDLTGLPWWIIISFSTVVMRLSLLPVLVLQVKKTFRIAQLFPKLPPPLPPPLSGRSFRDQYSLFEKKRKELGCPSFLWNLAYISVQFPFFILWMASIRSMCLKNHPGFDNGGTLWFHNLTEFPHGAFGPVFPILIAGLHYLNVQISFQTVRIERYKGIHGLMAKFYKLYLDILAIPLLLVGFFIPQGSLVYWTTNGLFTVVQQLSLRNDDVRKMLGLPVIRARLGNTAQSFIPENHSMVQQWPLRIAHISMRLSDDKTGSGNIATPEGSSIMEGNVSKSSSPEELLEIAFHYLAAGGQAQALPLIKTALEEKPDLYTALIGMGQTLYSNKLFPEAAECFEHAIQKMEQQNPLLPLAYLGAGIAHIQQDNKEVAIQLLQKLAELKEPEEDMSKASYFQGVVVLGSKLFAEGQKSEALKYLQLAAPYDPSVESYIKECVKEIEEQKSAEHQNLESKS